MLKIQKLSLAALMVSAVVSGSVFAEDKAAPSASDASYAVGALMGNQVKDLVDAQKEVIQYDNARILDGLKDALEGKVDVRKDEKIQQTLDGIQEQLVSAAKAKVEQQAKAAKEEGDKYRAEFAKKDGVKSTKDGLLYKITEAGKGDAIKATDTVKVHYTGKLPDGKVSGVAKITEPGKPTVEVPVVVTPAKIRTSEKGEPQSQKSSDNKENPTDNKSTKRLANTGESETNTGLAGLGLAMFGSALVVAKRRREDEE